MRYGNAEDFRAALEQRLRNQSSASDASLIRLRKHVSFERLLARLAVVAPDRWVLKGAYALDLRLGWGTGRPRTWTSPGARKKGRSPRA